MEYALLIYGDERRWEDPEVRATTHAAHGELMRQLGERGHKITGGKELEPSAAARTVRGSADSIAVTDGPFAETTEQFGGFYVVDTDDVDDLMRLAGIISFGGSIEIRPVVVNPKS